MRGYIHGALLIDFVGELGPISKTRLVLLDLATMVLQFVILTVVLERAALKKCMEGSLGPTANPTEEGLGLVGQDHDAEEQGVHRSAISGNVGIELQPLRPTGRHLDGDYGNSDGDAVFEASSSTTRTSVSEHPLDIFNSGQHVVANLHIIETIRTLYRQWLNGGVGVGTMGAIGVGATSASRSPLATTANFSIAARGRRHSRLGDNSTAT